jgi:hypothetical protein
VAEEDAEASKKLEELFEDLNREQRVVGSHQANGERRGDKRFNSSESFGNARVSDIDLGVELMLASCLLAVSARGSIKEHKLFGWICLNRSTL